MEKHFYIESCVLAYDIYFSTISSILNGSAAIIWSDVVRPFIKVDDAKATRISKGLGAYHILKIRNFKIESFC